MANDNIRINLSKRIVEYYSKLYWLTIKLHNTAARIGFKKEALYAHITPVFAQINEQSVNDEEKHQAVRRLMLSHVWKHVKCLKDMTKEHHEISGKLMTITRRLIFKCLLNKIIWTSKRKSMGLLLTRTKEWAD